MLKIDLVNIQGNLERVDLGSVELFESLIGSVLVCLKTRCSHNDCRPKSGEKGPIKDVLMRSHVRLQSVILSSVTGAFNF
jgi:hypothetical protein